MVVALGGVFIHSENPEYLANWYAQNFGLEYEYTEKYKAYYLSFKYRELDSSKERYAVFSILHNKNRPLIDGKFFTVNLRVDDMSGTIDKLKENNVEVRGPEAHDEGKFAWVNDPEGNYIELWEDQA